MGLLQFSGNSFGSPLVNYVSNNVSGNFANRNHFALFLALGCLATITWSFTRRDGVKWRLPVTVGVILLFSLTILASGSRAGFVVGLLALLLGPFIVREDISHMLRRTPRRIRLTSIVVLIAILSLFIIISIVSDRAISINRLAMLDVDGDMRSIGLGTVLEIVRSNLPFGSGIGTFDSVFRIAEPDGLLQVVYFNHAHNDFLEIALEAGIFGLSVLGVALAWWIKASLRVWRRPTSALPEQTLGRLGSTMILLIFLASTVDYPARTPLIMAMITVAACWLAWGEQATRKAVSLPGDGRSL